MINLGTHEKIALHFSGGKDSLVCLNLLKPQLERVTVVWVDTGDAAPETRAQMAAVAAQVPKFMHLLSDAPAQIKEAGYPTDVLSAWDTPFGRMLDSSRTAKLQTSYGCCQANLWNPMHEAMKTYGFTLVIRGQRDAEAKKGVIRSGHVEEGIEYLFPLQTWSGAEVVKYLGNHKIPMPPNYAYFDSSMDCLHCTGYMAENVRKLEYLDSAHPRAAIEVIRRLKYIRKTVGAELSHIDRALESYA